MAKKVTLEDIAREPHLSKYAVSRAISGKSGASEKTRERVLEACQRLGYVRSTPKASSQHIVLMIPKTDMGDPAFWMKVVQGVESGATKQGYLLHIKILREGDDPLAAQELENAAGVIFAGYRSVEYAKSVKASIPAVLMTYPPVPMFQMDCLFCADLEGSTVLCQKLLDWGHRCLVYCGDGERPSASHRLEGVRQVLAKHGLTLAQHIREEELVGVQDIMARWQREKASGLLPTAFLCESDTCANLVQRITSHLQLIAPKDISIVSFNNDLRDPRGAGVTGMALDKINFGKEAVHMLFDRIARPNTGYRRIAVAQQYLDNNTAGPCPQS